MIHLYLLIIIASIVIGLIGIDRKFGFWGYFFASILLTPIIGILLLLASDPKKKKNIIKKKLFKIMIKIYYTYFDFPLDESIFNNYLSKIPKKLQIKASKFLRWEDKHNFLFGKILLQNGLKEYGYSLDDVKISKYKKPFIDSIDFNISHSNNLVICAISKNNIGIDVEFIKNLNLNDFKEFFKKEWNEIINSKNQLESFYKYWTIKEAVLKAYGSGFLENLDIQIDENVAYFNNKIFYIKKLNIKDNYICHLVYQKKQKISLQKVEINLLIKK